MSRTRISWLASALAALLAALVLAACGGGSCSLDWGEVGLGAGGPTTATDAAPAQSGGMITVGAAQGIPQLNPAIRTFAWEEVLFPLLWNGLSKVTESGEVEPDLAEEWSVSEDQRTWTFRLKTGVRFSDGTPLTAATVVRAFEYYLDRETPTQEANKLAPVARVVARGEDTVVFSLRTANALFPSAITSVKIIEVGSLRNIDKRPVGTGPYVVSEFLPDDSVRLVRNDEYFGEPAKLDEIRLVKTSDPTAAVNSLRSGDLEVLWSMPASDAAQFEGDPAVGLLLPRTPSQWPSWEMDATSPPFDDPKARQAVAYATDREAILEAAYYGQGNLAPTNNALATDNPAYGGELEEYSYDLDKAKQLFAEAGVREGDTLTWWGTAGANPEWQTSGEILQASLKEIGINLKIENNEVSKWAEKFYPAGKRYPGMIVPNFQSTPPEPAYSLNFYLLGRCECNWDNPEFETAYRAAVAEPDVTARKELWGRVQTIINREVPLIVPLQATVVSAQAAGVTGAWVEGGGQLHLEGAGLAAE
jgi:peptide/nickel transport system substrate-binding protein